MIAIFVIVVGLGLGLIPDQYNIVNAQNLTNQTCIFDDHLCPLDDSEYQEIPYNK